MMDNAKARREKNTHTAALSWLRKIAGIAENKKR